MFAGQMGCEALNFLLKRMIKEERPKRTSPLPLQNFYDTANWQDDTPSIRRVWDSGAVEMKG